jgi:hypothetical protein
MSSATKTAFTSGAIIRQQAGQKLSQPIVKGISLATPVKLPPTQTNPSPCGFCCGTKFIEYEACPYCFGIREVPTL